MRLLSIRLDADGTREIGLRRSVRRLVAVVPSLLLFGLGFLAILISPQRRGWHDRFAGTKVVYDHEDLTAPWSRLEAQGTQTGPGGPGPVGAAATSKSASS